MLTGLYPPIHDRNWFSNYLRTYIERDVRQIKNVTDLIVFERFIRLLAGRTGQELNMTSLAVEVGADAKTIQSWIGILEKSISTTGVTKPVMKSTSSWMKGLHTCLSK